jgi:tol-pal system protein YbgF
MKLSRKLSLLVFTCTSLMSATALAQSYGDRALLDKVERLERDMNLMQREFFKNGGAPVAGSTGASSINVTKPQEGAALSVRITAIEEQLRALNGRIEETEHQQQQLSQQYNQLVEQIGYLQRTGSAPATGLPTASAVPATGTAAAPTTTPQQPFTNPTPTSVTNTGDPVQNQYNAAFELLKQTKYSEAEVALKDFLAQHEDSAQAGSAFYWLGETYYMQKDYEQAAIQFLRGYKKFPKGEKAPDSLLKLSMALGNLNKTKEACTSLGKLRDEFKNASNAIKQRAQEESKRLSCS